VDECYGILVLAENYGFYKVVHKLLEEIRGKVDSLDRACGLLDRIKVQSPQCLELRVKLIQMGERFIEEIFSDLEGMIFTDQWLNLPFIGIECLLTSCNFTPCSENTIFYAIIVWYQHDKASRLPHIKSLLEFINFTDFTESFLLNVVSQSQHYIPELSQDIEQKRIEAMEYKLKVKYSEPSEKIPSPPRRQRKNLHPLFKTLITQVTVTYIFSHMSSFQINQGRLSSPYFCNGYLFQFFIESVLKPGCKKNLYDHYHLKGGLRCQTLSDNYYLPIEFSMTIISAAEPRQFGPFKAIFESSKSAFGCILNRANENLTQLANLTSPIIKKDCLAIQIDMKF